MPACHYCVEFMPAWNKIVDEFKAEYGDKIQFLKVDGTEDRYTADRYGIKSFPSFIVLQPGTDGDRWLKWSPQHRDYASMKKWIKGLVFQHQIKPITAALAPSANALPTGGALEAALPVVAGQQIGMNMIQDNKQLQ